MSRIATLGSMTKDETIAAMGAKFDGFFVPHTFNPIGKSPLAKSDPDSAAYQCLVTQPSELSVELSAPGSQMLGLVP